MGCSRWSDEHYTDRVATRAARGVATFAYDADVKSGKVENKTHEKLDPFGVTMRESCDSETHPTSRAVAVFFDVTGSMAGVPRVIQSKLPQLMGLVIRKALDHPHIMVGAIGDATAGDDSPLQVGQFEAGIEIEDDLTNLRLVGGGGGGLSESYQLAMYFMARHTKIDCFDKRGEKGYLFLIGDEKPYNTVSKEEVKRLIGDTLQADLPVEELLVELEKRYEVFFILPNMTSNYNNKTVSDRWQELLGQRILRLEDPAGISELIASTIAIHEGKVDIGDLEKDLKTAGATKEIAHAVSKALVPASSDTRLTKKKHGADLVVAESGAGSGVTTL